MKNGQKKSVGAHCMHAQVEERKYVSDNDRAIKHHGSA